VNYLRHTSGVTDRRLFLQFSRANRLLTAWVNGRVVDELGVSAAQLGTLYYVAKHPRCSASEIANVLDLNKSAMSGMVARLERAGMLRREPNPKDARGSLLSLTARGDEVRARSLAVVRKLTIELTEGFDEGEVNVVARFLASMIERCGTSMEEDR